MAVGILKNGREGEIWGFILGFCSDGNLGEVPFPGDPNFTSVSYPATSAGAGQPCTLFQQLVAAPNCLVSVNGLTAGDCLIVPAAGGGTTCVPMGQVGGVAVKVASNDPVFTTLVGVAMDVTLCGGNGYWTRGQNNAQITMPGRVLLYHELVGHALHHCNGTFNAADPEGQAIADENVLRAAIGEPQRTAHEGGCGGGGNCFVATAAFGSAIAPEVQELREFRDRTLRATRWGVAFFDEWWEHYYAFSPQIVASMKRDPRMAELVRFVLVSPLVIALRLFLALPDDPDDPAGSIVFARRAVDEYAAWLRELPFTRSLTDPDASAAVHEFAEALALLSNPRLRSAAIEALVRAGLLPLLSSDARPEYEPQLRRSGLSDEEIGSVFVRGEADG